VVTTIVSPAVREEADGGGVRQRWQWCRPLRGNPLSREHPASLTDPSIRAGPGPRPVVQPPRARARGGPNPPPPPSIGARPRHAPGRARLIPEAGLLKVC
jgi:hypothetical protein